MRDVMTLFHNKAAIGADSAVVDARSSQPGVGSKCKLSVTLSPGGTTDLTLTVKSADNEDMTGATTDAVLTIPADIVEKGGVVYSDGIPEHCKQFMQVETAGATGAADVTAGLDYGLRSGKMATKLYNV